jgi:hypothetical protein
MNTAVMNIAVYDVLGQQILVDRFYGNQMRIQTADWSNGVYMVHIKQAGKSKVLRLIKS